MALAPPRPCPAPSCGRFRCTNPAHQVQAWRTRELPRIRGRALQRLRADLFRRQPWCVECLKTGVRTRPTIRDHIVPLAEGGRDIESNVQALCLTCSDLKSQQEAQRGLRRSR